MQKIISSLWVFIFCFISCSFLIACSSPSTSTQNDTFLYSVYTNHKEDLAKFKNYHSTQNVATKLARFSNGSTSMPSHSKSGYYKEDIVSYYEGDALQTFLYEDDREFKKLLEVQEPPEELGYDESLEDYLPTWQNDAKLIKSLITLDLPQKNGNTMEYIIAVEFNSQPQYIHAGAIYRKDAQPMPDVLTYFLRSYDYYQNGIQNTNITISQDNELVYYIDFIPVEKAIKNGVYVAPEGFYSADKKIFYKVNATASKVVLEDGVEIIDSEAFIYPTEHSSINPNTTLKEVVLPNSVRRIEKYAFGGCIMLERINKPKSLEYLDADWQTDVGMYSKESAESLYGKPENPHLFDFEID